jgi:hypothetical protein
MFKLKYRFSAVRLSSLSCRGAHFTRLAGGWSVNPSRLSYCDPDNCGVRLSIAGSTKRAGQDRVRRIESQRTLAPSNRRTHKMASKASASGPLNIYTVGDRVWVPHEEEAWLPGRVEASNASTLEIATGKRRARVTCHSVSNLPEALKSMMTMMCLVTYACALVYVHISERGLLRFRPNDPASKFETCG